MLWNVSIPVQVSNFPRVGGSGFAAALNGNYEVNFTLADILRAAIVAGYPRFTSIPSFQFFLWRVAALHMALRFSDDGYLIQPPEWGRLDPSEKGAISSILGVIVTKLLVEKILNAPIFLYLDVHFHLIYPRAASGKAIKTRPDFAARAVTGEWFSIEAKGRTEGRKDALAAGKTQATALGIVNGSPIEACVVSMTYFKYRILNAYFVDPEPDEDSVLEGKIEPIVALNSYFNGLFRYQEFSNGLGYKAVPGIDENVYLWESSELDIQFGLLPSVKKTLGRNAADESYNILKKLAVSDLSNRCPYLGPDGIIVIPGKSWDVEKSD